MDVSVLVKLPCRYPSLLPYEAAAWTGDKTFLAWAEGAGAIVIATELKVQISKAWADLYNLDTLTLTKLGTACQIKI